MAQFDIREAETNFSQLLDLVERGEEVILAKNGIPVARIIGMESKKSILGIGIGDPNYRDISDELATAPMDEEELARWYGKENP